MQPCNVVPAPRRVDARPRAGTEPASAGAGWLDGPMQHCCSKQCRRHGAATEPPRKCARMDVAHTFRCSLPRSLRVQGQGLHRNWAVPSALVMPAQEHAGRCIAGPAQADLKAAAYTLTPGLLPPWPAARPPSPAPVKAVWRGRREGQQRHQRLQQAGDPAERFWLVGQLGRLSRLASRVEQEPTVQSMCLIGTEGGFSVGPGPAAP